MTGHMGNVRRRGLTRCMRTNLHHLIEDRARSHPDSPAMTLEQETLGVAAGLGELGVAREQWVAVFVDTDALLEEMKSKLRLYMVPSSVVVRDAISRSLRGDFGRALLREELAT
jgi:hypothetical protein